MSRRLFVLLVGALGCFAFLASDRAASHAQDLQPGALKRFVDKGEYVEDTQTGLLWQKDGDASGKKTFYQAADYAEGLKLGGITGWRVPSKEELQSIFPATDAPWVDTKYNKEMCCKGPGEYNSYWTSDRDVSRPDYAYIYQWYAQGGANNCFASKNYGYVRCIHDAVKKK